MERITQTQAQCASLIVLVLLLVYTFILSSYYPPKPRPGLDTLRHSKALLYRAKAKVREVEEVLDAKPKMAPNGLRKLVIMEGE